MSAWPLDRTLFVEAGAGTGKTFQLVGRVVALVKAGNPMRGIAAITFTEAAASELRKRIRQALQEAGEDKAVDELDEAAISTLHGFAQRILMEHPFEAGLPPAVDVLDEIQSTLAFDERWKAFLDRLFDDPAHATVLLRATALGLNFEDQLRQIAEIFNNHWDRLESVVIVPPALTPVDPTVVAAALSTALALRHHCIADADKLAAHLDGLVGLPERLLKATDELEILHLLETVERFGPKIGNKENYPTCNIDEIRDALVAADEAKAELLIAIRAEVLDHLLIATRTFVLDGAESRRRAGHLEFHDLLVRARDLVHNVESVRAALSARYTHLLIDEFQDTDPIQIDLANAIAGDVPGKLFFVGDGKQSIYRFRRASIELFASVKEAMEQDNVMSLTENRRSVPGILDFVNRAFADLLTEPHYEPLAPVRPADRRAASPVVILGDEHPKGVNIAAIREKEADEIADAIGRLQGDHGLALQEIAILMPTRTSLPQLELALEAAAIPYRVASASLVWATQEIRDLLAVLHVIDNPSDQLSLLAALRSPALGCADVDLLTYRQAGGAWHLHAPTPSTLAPEHPVVAAITVLRSLHDARWWAGVSGMVERVLRELRFFELAVAHHRPRDRWRRLRWVLDQARAFDADRAGSLREFLAWTDIQADENARVKESPVPEVDDDAVLIYTVHGAKGLEFPAVILTGLNRPPVNMNNAAAVHWGPTRPEAKTTYKFRTAGFDELDAKEKEMDAHERMRLLYVAATRAMDHLVISLHRKFNDKLSHAALLAKVLAEAPHLARAFGDRQLLLQAPPSISPPVAAGDVASRRRGWDAGRLQLIESLAAAPVRAATSMKPAPEGGDEVDIDTPPWRKGRAGTSVGRAVHATLQTIDLATGADLAPTAAAQAVAEGVESRRDDVERLARVALESASVRAAVSSGRYWRELYVAAPVGSTLVEGFIDLLYDTPDGLVVVDYKTDSVRSPADVDAAVARYRLQGATYAVALEHSLKRPVHAVRFVFTSGGTAAERDIADLDAAKAEVVARL